MKGILKLFPVAMAVLALASCSDIDSLDSKSGNAVAEDGDLVISFDPMEVDGEVVATRGMRTPTPSTLNFEEGDLVNVYDADLYKHDVYEYEPGSPKGKFNVIAPQRITSGSQYALYPAGAVKRGYWDRESDKSIAEFAIDPIIVYDASSEAKIGDQMYYGYELPSAGKAEWNASANRVDVKNFRALTGILQLNLEDALYNANWIKISSGKKISGTFKVILDTNAWDAIKLEEGDDDLITDNAIYVDMRQVPSRVNCVYVPIIAGIDTNVDGLTVEVAKDDVNDPTTIAAANWYDTGLKFPNKVIAANKIYRGTKKFDLTEMTPNRVTEMLAQYKNSESPIELNCLDFTTNVAGSAEGNTIVLPDELDQDVTINFDADAFTGYTRTGTGYYVILQGEEYDKTVTINVNDKLGTGNQLPIRVNMPNGNVVIAGNYESTTALRLQAAKSVQIGDGKTVTAYTPSTFKVENIENLTIAYQATVTGDLTTTANNTSVTINGTLDGDVDMSTAVKNGTKLTIHGFDGDTSVTPALPKVNASVTGDVTTKCDVEISLPLEGIAIASGKTLTLNGYDNTLTLVQGYVDKFVAEVTNTGSWEESKINVKLDSDNEGLAAFKTIDAKNDANGNLTKIDFTESVWDGKIIDAAFTDYKNKLTVYQENSVNVSKFGLFTASQLGSLISASTIRVLNDINMKDKNTYVGFDLTNTLLGTHPAKDTDPADEDINVIKNLCLTNAAAKGLINTASGTKIKNLKLEKVTATKAADASGIGALIGSNTAAIAIENVAITGINFAAATGKKLENVGGLIGTTSEAVTATSVTTAGTIDGYTALGGLIGSVTADELVTIAKSNTEGITIAQSYASGKEYDIKYAAIGSLIGTASAVATAVNAPTIDAATKIGTISHEAHKSAEKLLDTAAGTGNPYYFKPQQSYIGYSGAGLNAPAGYTTTIAGAKIGGKTYNNYLVPTFTTTNQKSALGSTPVVSFSTAAATAETALYYFSATL